VEALKPAERIAAQSRELNLNRPRVPAGGGAAAGGATGAAAWVGEGEGDGDGDGDGVGVGDGDAVDGWTAGDARGVGLVRARAESGVDWCSRDRIEIVATTEPTRITAIRTMRMGSRAGPAVAQLRNLVAAP
jgi:hypothetical protein